MQIGTQAERDVRHTLDKQMDDFSDFAFFVVLFVVALNPRFEFGLGNHLSQIHYT